MLEKSFDIDAYLRNAEENFSGFDGDEDYDIEWDAADGGVYDWYEGVYANAGGGAAPSNAKPPSPYQVTVQNTTGSNLTVVLFGRNQFLLEPNFGSATGLLVTPAQSNVSYAQLLQQSASQPFETSLVRVQSSNTTQVTQILTLTVTDANGQSATQPIINQSYFSAYQQQSGIIDIPFQMKIDGNTSITSIIFGTTTVTYTFFPAEKVNVAKGLSGNRPVTNYGNPQVNIGGMSFPTGRGKRLGGGRPRRRR